MERVALALQGLASEVRMLTWGEPESKDDAADFVAHGGTREDLIALVKAAPRWERAAPAAVAARSDEATTTVPDDNGSTRRVIVTRASEIVPVPVTWTWDERIPAGMVSLVAGREGTGKSTMVLDRVARLTRGDLEGIHFGTPRSAVLVAAEDSWRHTIVPRLMAAGADLDRVLRVQIRTMDLAACELSLPDDVDALAATITEREVGLVVLDPLISRLSRRLDTHRDAEVRQGLEPLARLADEASAAIVGLIHVSKAATRDPLTAVMGSRGFVALARAVLSVAVDPDDRRRRVMSQTKCNVGRDDTAGLESLAYAIESADIETPHGTARTSRVVWKGTAARGVREIMAAADGDGEQAGARRAAQEWLADLLSNGPMPSEEVKGAAGQAGLAWGTVRRAQESLHIQPRKQGGRFGGDPRWFWELPSRPPAPEDAQPPLKVLNENKCASSGAGEHLQAEATLDGGEDL
jgi:AAA domain